MLKIIAIGFLIGFVMGGYTNSENNNGKIIYPKAVKGGFKLGVLRDILTCTIATFLAMFTHISMGVTDILPLVIHGAIAALLGKEYLVRQRNEAINEAHAVSEKRRAELDAPVDSSEKKDEGKGAG